MCWIHNYFYEIEFQTIKYHIREKFGTIRDKLLDIMSNEDFEIILEFHPSWI